MNAKKHNEFVLDVIAGLEAQGLIVYGSRIAVVRDPEEEKVGSIIIPEEGKRKEPRGTIVRIGLGVETDELLVGCSVGERVMFTKYNPIQFKVTLPDGQKVDLELMHSSDLYLGWGS